VLPVVLIGGGGVLLGGAWSMRSQGARKSALIVALFGLLLLATGILYLVPMGKNG
jgi:hypothetical protein